MHMSTKNIDFNESIFICSKPLQFFNCASIIKYYNIQKASIIIVNKSISDCNMFLDFIYSSSYRDLFQFVYVVDTHVDAEKKLCALSFETLFIEDDRTSFYGLFAQHKRKYLCVFEEGVSTYYSSYKYKMGFLKKTKWAILSYFQKSGMQFGEGEKTDYVLVTSAHVFKLLNKKLSSKVIVFPGIVNEVLDELNEWRDYIRKYLPQIEGDYVALVLGTWGSGWDSEVLLSDIKKNCTKVIFKPHPHDGSAWTGNCIHVLNETWVPAEVYILILEQLSEKLVVYHYSSSSFFYCMNVCKNVKFIDLLNNKFVSRVYDLNKDKCV